MAPTCFGTEGDAAVFGRGEEIDAEGFTVADGLEDGCGVGPPLNAKAENENAAAIAKA